LKVFGAADAPSIVNMKYHIRADGRKTERPFGVSWFKSDLARFFERMDEMFNRAAPF